MFVRKKVLRSLCARGFFSCIMFPSCIGIYFSDYDWTHFWASSSLNMLLLVASLCSQSFFFCQRVPLMTSFFFFFPFLFLADYRCISVWALKSRSWNCWSEIETSTGKSEFPWFPSRTAPLLILFWYCLMNYMFFGQSSSSLTLCCPETRVDFCTDISGLLFVQPFLVSRGIIFGWLLDYSRKLRLWLDIIRVI